VRDGAGGTGQLLPPRRIAIENFHRARDAFRGHLSHLQHGPLRYTLVVTVVDDAGMSKTRRRRVRLA